MALPHHGAILTMHNTLANLQNTQTPDINLERDLIELDNEGVIGSQLAETLETNKDAKNKKLLGSQADKATKASKASKTLEDAKRFRYNITTILISALLFLMILAWFDFMQTAFYEYFDQVRDIPASSKFGYALMATIVVLVLVSIIYYVTM